MAKQKTKTKAKRHVNIFCIAPNSDASQREKFGIGLALKGIRAKCFTEDDARLAGADYIIRTSIIDGIIRAADIVTVDGDEVTPAMLNQIQKAVEMNKPIWCAESVKAAVRDSNVKCYPGKLDELCWFIIDN